MSELKQQSGYTRASISAQALSGAVPVIDLNKKGDLQKLFASKAPASFGDSPSAKAASLNDAAPRSNAQQQAAKKDAPQQPEQSQNVEQQEPVRAQTTPDSNPDNKAQNNLQAAPQPAADNAASARFVFVPPQFAPVLSAGILSALHNEKAIDIAEGPDGYKQGDEFKFGSAAGRHQRRMMERIENDMEANRGEGRANSSTMLMQYAAEQQRQQFMRSTEYSVAMQTVDREIRQMHVERQAVQTRIAGLNDEIAQFDQKIETATIEVAQAEEVLEGHRTVNDLKKENKAAQDNVDDKQNRSTEILKSVNELHNASLKLEGKDIIITKMEDGKPVKYKIDENGQQQKTEAGGIYEVQQMVFSKKDADGNIRYVGSGGNDVTPEQKAQIDKALQAAGVKAEDVIPSHEDVVKARAKAEADQDREGVNSSDINRAMNIEDETHERLQTEAAKWGLSEDDLKTLDTRIESMEKIIAAKKAEIARWKDEKVKSVEELEKEQKALDRLDKRLEESTKFKERLQNGEFKDAKEMEAAKPSYLKQRYEMELANKKAQEQKQTNSVDPTTKQDNTSRTNGSAAAAYEGTANNGNISGQFQTAAANTTSETKPEAPAPAPSQDDDMEYAAARQPAKPQAAGMTL